MTPFMQGCVSSASNLRTVTVERPGRSTHRNAKKGHGKMRLSKKAALEVAADAGIDPAEATRAIDQVDRDRRDGVLTAMGAGGATAEEAVDASRRGVDMTQYAQKRSTRSEHEEAIRRLTT
ncbi:hypothetical protein [Actinomadura sp. NPDC049753]|uniref:hypothetical protein n=1 Tax=Actinomadura sp. NPDC049753 TaxID=3154739 RepID=UPI00342E72AE